MATISNNNASYKQGNDDHEKEEEEEEEGVQETEEELATLFSTEAGLLDALMYRNKNQHGRAGYWKRLQQVKRHIKDLNVPALLSLLSTVRRDLLLSQQKQKQQQKKAAATATIIRRKRCTALGMAVQQCCDGIESCVAAAELLVHEVAQGFFLNLMVVFLALLGRMMALLQHLGQVTFGLYQALEAKEEEAGGTPIFSSSSHQLLRPREVAQALSLAFSQGEGRRVKGEIKAAEKEGGGGGGSKKDTHRKEEEEDEDDLGISLGSSVPFSNRKAATTAAVDAFMRAPELNAAAKARTKPPTTLTSNVIPATSSLSVSASTSSTTIATKRAMLASEYSSSSEEEEEEIAPPPPPSSSPPLSKEEEEEESSAAAAISFVIDREPEAKKKKDKETKETEKKKKTKRRRQEEEDEKCEEEEEEAPPSALPSAPTPAPATTAPVFSFSRPRSKKKKKQAPLLQKKAETGGGGGGSSGSLLDAIDDIFKTAKVPPSRKGGKIQYKGGKREMNV